MHLCWHLHQYLCFGDYCEFEILVDQRLVKKLPPMSVRNHSTYCPSGLKVEVTDQDPLNSLIGNIACTLSLFSSSTLLSPFLGFCLFVCVCAQNAPLEWSLSCIHGYLWSTISSSLIKHEWDNRSYIRSQFEGHRIKILAFKFVAIKFTPHKRECILFLIHNFGSLFLSL